MSSNLCRGLQCCRNALTGPKIPQDDVDHSAVELDSSKSPLQDRFYRPTVTTTLFITSSITTYRLVSPYKS